MILQYLLGQVGVKDDPWARGRCLFNGSQPLGQQFGDYSPPAPASREMVIASGCGSRLFSGSTTCASR